MRPALILMAALAAGPVMLSRAETITRVKQELARRLSVPPDQIEVVTESDATWPDSNFGCPARKPLDEPRPIQGFALTLSYDGRSYVYHTDRLGHFKRCDPGKPLAPISR